MKHETFLRNCRVGILIHNTCWLVNQSELFIWATDNIKACEQQLEHYPNPIYRVEGAQRSCIVALIKHGMRQV